MEQNNGIIQTKGKFGRSSVTVTWNSLNGNLYVIKAGDFLKAMKMDVKTWRSFELHSRRKQGENETRVAQMKNILENKYENEEDLRFKSPLFKYIDTVLEKSAHQPKNRYKGTITNWADFNSDQNIPSLKENFKRIEYSTVAESNKDEPKPQVNVEKSIILGDKLGNLNVSRPNNPFLSTAGVGDSRDFFSSRRSTNTNIMKMVDKSQELYSDYSESDDYESEVEAEVEEDQNGLGHFNAKKMPFLKSICKKIWKKPK